MVRTVGHLILEDDQILRSGTNDGVNGIPGCLQRLGNRIKLRGSYATAHACNNLAFEDWSRVAQWSGYIGQRIAGFLCRQEPCCFADGLHDEGNGAVSCVAVDNRQRDAFAGIVDSNDHEVAGKTLPGNKRSLITNLVMVGARTDLWTMGYTTAS